MRGRGSVRKTCWYDLDIFRLGVVAVGHRVGIPDSSGVLMPNLVFQVAGYLTVTLILAIMWFLVIRMMVPLYAVVAPMFRTSISVFLYMTNIELWFCVMGTFSDKDIFNSVIYECILLVLLYLDLISWYFITVFPIRINWKGPWDPLLKF